MVIDAQATPAMAQEVIARVRTVTDKPIKYVVLSHYHAVRVLGASAYGAQGIIASDLTYRLIVERGEQDKASKWAASRASSAAPIRSPGLTWPTLTFESGMSVFLGRREIKLLHVGAGHTAGDIMAWVPDADVIFSGDLVEYHSACYCGDAYLREWPQTLEEIREFEPRPRAGPGRCARARRRCAAVAMTRDFVTTLYGAAELSVSRGA